MKNIWSKYIHEKQNGRPKHAVKTKWQPAWKWKAKMKKQESKTYQPASMRALWCLKIEMSELDLKSWWKIKFELDFELSSLLHESLIITEHAYMQDPNLVTSCSLDTKMWWCHQNEMVYRLVMKINKNVNNGWNFPRMNPNYNENKS